MIWKKKTIRDLLPPPVKAAHAEYSMILSARDEASRASEDLLKIAIDAIQAAVNIDLSFLSNDLANLWPGEHYRLLAAFVQIMKPNVVIEIGTATGLSALSMLPFFSGKLITFDIQPWHKYPNTVLRQEIFGRLEQIVADVSADFETYRPFFEKSSFIFIDATHDGILEQKLLDLLATVRFENPPILFFDDIRVWTMLKMWREIRFPKLDLNSFGHWSGSGIVML